VALRFPALGQWLGYVMRPARPYPAWLALARVALLRPL